MPNKFGYCLSTIRDLNSLGSLRTFIESAVVFSLNKLSKQILGLMLSRSRDLNCCTQQVHRQQLSRLTTKARNDQARKITTFH